jgi:large subunit ribosomal protein L13
MNWIPAFPPSLPPRRAFGETSWLGEISPLADAGMTFYRGFMKTYLPKVSEIEHKCYVIDAKDKILGKVASKAASVLRGKHKRTWTPFLDTGDSVIIINADKVKVTGKKLTDKMYTYNTGYPSGFRETSLGNMLAKRPVKVLELAVSRMFPSGPLAYKQTSRLKVYAGDKHSHAAQKPIALEV